MFAARLAPGSLPNVRNDRNSRRPKVRSKYRRRARSTVPVVSECTYALTAVPIALECFYRILD